jgi:hypothetical protein
MPLRTSGAREAASSFNAMIAAPSLSWVDITRANGRWAPANQDQPAPSYRATPTPNGITFFSPGTFRLLVRRGKVFNSMKDPRKCIKP